MTNVPIYPFEVVPVGAGTFEPFVLGVPALTGADFAARRAWWQVFHLLGRQGVDVDAFRVYVFTDDERGAEVGMGGVLEAAGEPAATVAG